MLMTATDCYCSNCWVTGANNVTENTLLLELLGDGRGHGMLMKTLLKAADTER